MSLEIPLAADLPPRTWRQWWLAWPKWFRIGCWAFAGLALLHVALAVRFYFGLQESAAVSEFRRPGIYVTYAWEQSERFRGQNTLMAGLYGRSPSQVESVQVFFGLRDSDLRHIGSNFHNLQQLVLNGMELEAHQLTHLRNCRRLRALHLAETNVDDTMADCLKQFPRLLQLSLSGTLIGDATFHAAVELPELKYLDVSFTDVTPAAVEAARANPRYRAIAIKTERDMKSRDSKIVNVIRWSDGSRSATFKGGYEFRYDRLMGDDADPDVATHGGGCSAGWSRHMGWGRSGPGGFQGTYQATLILGKYESEPVVVKLDDDPPSSKHVEFRMPVTREEALRSAE